MVGIALKSFSFQLTDLLPGTEFLIARAQKDATSVTSVLVLYLLDACAYSVYYSQLWPLAKPDHRRVQRLFARENLFREPKTPVALCDTPPVFVSGSCVVHGICCDCCCGALSLFSPVMNNTLCGTRRTYTWHTSTYNIWMSVSLGFGLLVFSTGGLSMRGERGS